MNNKLCFLCSVLIISFGCSKPVPITYQDALEHAMIDTMVMIGQNGERTPLMQKSMKSLVGAQLPLFEIRSMDGATVNNEMLQGKVTVLNFWFIGCIPCQAEMPGFNALMEKYKTAPVTFLAASRNQPKDIAEFIAEHPFNATQIPLAENLIAGVFQYKWGYPGTIVADADGKILFAESGGMSDSTAVQAIQDKLIPVIEGALKGI